MGAPWKAYLIDLDGTMYHGNRMILGADRLISELRHRQIPYLFVTNNSSRTPKRVAVHLQELGIPAKEEDVCTSAAAAAEYIASEMPGCKVAPIGESGLIEALKEAGLKIDTDQPDLVVQGIDRTFTYDTLASAARFIHSGAKYILTNPDLLLPSKDGMMPGAGTISAAIQAATGVKPTVIGKPSGILMKYAFKRLGLHSQEVAVIGDNMMTDIAAGVNAGCGTILVYTGVTNVNNFEEYAAKAGIRPDVICQDLAEVQELICGLK